MELVTLCAHWKTEKHNFHEVAVVFLETLPKNPVNHIGTVSKWLIWVFKDLWVKLHTCEIDQLVWSNLLIKHRQGNYTKLTLGWKFEIEQFVYQQKWLSQHHVRNIELEAGWCNSKQQLRRRIRNVKLRNSLMANRVVL